MNRFVTVLLIFVPFLASAQTRPGTFAGFVNVILDIIQLLVAGIFALTLVVLIWGIAQAWILHGGDAKKIEEGGKIVTVGIIVLVVMSGLWGIVALLRSGFFGL
jgi:hypothetical protein